MFLVTEAVKILDMVTDQSTICSLLFTSSTNSIYPFERQYVD